MTKADKRTSLIAGLMLVFGIVSTLFLSPFPDRRESSSYIVQGTDMAAVRAGVETVGGEITHELNIIRSYGVSLTNEQHRALGTQPGVLQLYRNRSLETAEEQGRRGEGLHTSDIGKHDGYSQPRVGFPG